MERFDSRLNGSAMANPFHKVIDSRLPMISDLLPLTSYTPTLRTQALTCARREMQLAKPLQPAPFQSIVSVVISMEQKT